MKGLYAMYPLVAGLHFLLISGLERPFYFLGDVYLVIMGMGLVFLIETVQKTAPHKVGTAFLAGTLIRMLLGLVVVILPLIKSKPEGFKSFALEFVAVYLVMAAIETKAMIRIVNKR